MDTQYSTNSKCSSQRKQTSCSTDSLLLFNSIQFPESCLIYRSLSRPTVPLPVWVSLPRKSVLETDRMWYVGTSFLLPGRCVVTLNFRIITKNSLHYIGTMKRTGLCTEISWFESLLNPTQQCRTLFCFCFLPTLQPLLFQHTKNVRQVLSMEPPHMLTIFFFKKSTYTHVVWWTGEFIKSKEAKLASPVIWLLE